MRRFLCTAVFVTLVPAAGTAPAQLLPESQESFTVADIRLEGLQRIAPSSIFGLLDISVGDRISNADVAEIIRDIYASDNFEDVEILREDNVLIIQVEERPSISDIEVEGNNLIPTEALMENMENAGLAVGQVFQPAVLESMQLALEEQYVGQGLYGAQVDIEVEEQERNRVAISININEGDPAKIVHINIVGNEAFPEEELLDLFELRESHFTSFFRKDDRYSREKINGDLERLTSYYMDQGYINFEVDSTQVSVSPEMEEVYITVNISEGEVYRVNEVELAGDLVGSEQLLRRVIQVRPGQVFSQQLVTTSSDFMTQLLTNRGYFFAEVEGIPSIDEENQTVDVTFFVEPGDRTYVNRISFFGNTNTADEVLRREMRQMEGAPASTVALEQSKVRLERLGFFSEVEYDTNEVPGTGDQIDVDFSVQEQPSGSIGGSIGYAQVQGLVLQANLQQNNFLGTGKQVGINANTSRFSTNYSFNYYDPYYTIDGVSRGFSLNYSTSDYAELNLARYSTDQFGGTVTYGYQISETQNMNFNFGYSHIDITAGEFAVQEIRATPSLDPSIDRYVVEPLRDSSVWDPDTGTLLPVAPAVTRPISELSPSVLQPREGFIDREGDSFDNFTVGLNWTKSTLNRGLFPTAGNRQRLQLQVSVPGSDLEYYRLSYLNEIYIPVYGEWGLHARVDLGYGDGYGNTEQLPFFQNFYAGGLGTVRGFERNTLGPRSTPPAQWLLQRSDFLYDQDGNIITDNDGNPVTDPGSEAYVLTEGETGPELASQQYPTRRNAPFGGNIQVVGTLEMLFPMPFIEDRSQVRSSFFLDAGNVFSSYCSRQQELNNNCFGLDFGEFRYSAGLSVTWLSGFGPMTFSLAAPLNDSEIDETEAFQFNIGTTF